MIKLIETPPIRFPDRPIEEASERWWIAKVKPRQEKVLAMDLLEQSIEYFLPLITKNTPRPGTKTPRLFNVPLFPGYICFAQNTPRNIFSSGRVVNIIEVRNQKRFIRQCSQIYRVIQGKYPVGAFEGFIKGTVVEIEYGPLRGLQGIVYRNQANSRLVLSIDGLGRACIPVTVDSTWVKSIEKDVLVED